MAKAKVFVSSTFFDLTQVRDDIRNSIVDLGHEPLLSEFPSFPVLPELNTIENCKRNVRENTDIFVLIVGGRRGSLDPVSQKTITNLEYETAKNYGIDTFVFVQKAVLNLIPVWEKNPSIDFSSNVDSSEVFSFIRTIQADQKWIYAFEYASKISHILKTQLSIFLKYLLSLKKEGKLRPLKEFLEETPRAQQLALELPPYWQYLLTIELLQSKVGRIRQQYGEFERGLIFKKSTSMSGKEYIQWSKSKFSDIVVISDIIKLSIESEIPATWNPESESFGPLNILSTVNILVSACAALIDWEVDMKAVNPPTAFGNLKLLMQGLTPDLLVVIERYLEELNKVFELPNPEESEHTINLKVAFPEDRLQRITSEAERLSHNTHEWLDDY